MLAAQLDEYLSLNPLKINSVFTKYGISNNVPINVETVVQAYTYFKEPFAVDLFDALYPEIQANMSMPVLSNATGAATVTTDASVVQKTSFWEGFASVLNALSAAAPNVANSIATVKYGNQQTQPGQTGLQPGTQYTQPQTGVNQSILIYIGIGFLAVIAAILVFKKVK